MVDENKLSDPSLGSADAGSASSEQAQETDQQAAVSADGAAATTDAADATADADSDGAAARTAGEADAGAEEDAGQKAVDEFSKSLRTLPGKWYVLHTYSGYERRVKQNLEARIQNFGLEDRVYQVEVPLEEVEKHTEKGRKVITRVRIPGYVLIRMEPGDEDAFRIVRETEAVTGFVGLQSEPIPLSRKEVVSMMGPMISQKALKAAGQGEKAAKKRVQEVSFKVGDQVTVTDGPFASMPGVVAAVSPQTQKVTVTISIFDRDTPVELGFGQIEKAEDAQK